MLPNLPVDGPSAGSFVYDATDSLKSASLTFGSKTCTYTLQRSAGGELEGVEVVFDGRKRTVTLTYTGGNLSGFTRVTTHV